MRFEVSEAEIDGWKALRVVGVVVEPEGAWPAYEELVGKVLRSFRFIEQK